MVRRCRGLVPDGGDEQDGDGHPPGRAAAGLVVAARAAFVDEGRASLVPLLVVGAGFGMITAWWELEVNRCTGPDFDFTPVQRLLIAGRTAWFCCWKLFWPARLTFIYPRWHIDAHAAWQYVFPLSAAAVVALAWSLRRWSRGPLAAVLYFGGTLVPVLGFFNLYTFRYSFVADHYQYLASLGMIALFFGRRSPAAAADGRLAARGRTGGRQRVADRAGRADLAAVRPIHRRANALRGHDRPKWRVLDGL